MDNLEITKQKLKKTLYALFGFLVLLVFLSVSPFFSKDLLKLQKYFSADVTNVSSVSVTVANSPPSVDSQSLNGGAAITLNEAGSGSGTKTITVSANIDDLNGYQDLVSATVAVYQVGTTPACDVSHQDNDNCYFATVPVADFTGCSGTSCLLTKTFDIYYYAKPTLIGNSTDGWLATITPSDQAGAGSAGDTAKIAMNALQEIDVSALTYKRDGSAAIPPQQTSNGSNTTTVTNAGNVSVDFYLHGTALTCPSPTATCYGTIPTTNQKYDLSSFAYTDSPGGTALQTSDPVSTIGADIVKATQGSHPSTAPVYWQILIPGGTMGALSGTTTFTAAPGL